MSIRDSGMARLVVQRASARTSWRVSWVLAALTLAISGATGVVARQADLEPHGRVFLRSDGILYVYKYGLKYRIQMTDVSDDVIDAVPVADFSVDRLGQLFALSDSTASAIAVAPPSPVLAAPAPISLPGPYVAVANPNPGDSPLSSGYLMQGKAFDPAASPDQGAGVDRVRVFLEDRDRGGLFLAEARLGTPNSARPPAASLLLRAGRRLSACPPACTRSSCTPTRR